MVETAAFFSLDEDSGSDEEGGEHPSRRPSPVKPSKHAHHSSLALHLEYPLAVPDPALSPTSRGGGAPTPVLPAYTPGGSFSLLDFDFGVPPMTPEAVPSLAAVTTSDDDDQAVHHGEAAIHRGEPPSPPLSHTESDQPHLHVGAGEEGEVEPPPRSDASSSSRPASLVDDPCAAFVRQYGVQSSSRSVGDDLSSARPAPALATPPVPAGGPFSRASQADPFSTVNPIEARAHVQIPMARQGSQPTRAASGAVSELAGEVFESVCDSAMSHRSGMPHAQQAVQGTANTNAQPDGGGEAAHVRACCLSCDGICSCHEALP